MEDEHECKQSAALATIAEQLKYIKETTDEIKSDQKKFLDDIANLRGIVNQANIDRAKYPAPDKVAEYLKKIDQHETMITIIGGGLVFVATWLSGVLQKLLWGG